MKRVLFIIFFIIVVILTVILLSSCNEINKGPGTNISLETGLIYINDSKSLVYHEDTKIVYIMFRQFKSTNKESYGYLAPFISENGNYYKYDDTQLIEIIK